VCAFDQLRQAVEVEAGGLDDMPVIAGIQDETRKTILEEIQLTCCPLDIGQGRRVCRLQKLEPLPADEDEFEISDQLLVMLLADAEEVHDLSVQIGSFRNSTCAPPENASTYALCSGNISINRFASGRFPPM
jgi:hypothetical protein